MAYLALYRKYRPTTFDGLIGQEHIVKTLVNQIESGRIGHAYLFTGSRGTGKTSAAKIFAKAINCLKPMHGSPCGKCEVCSALSDPSNIDVIEIDAASNNGVNEIRDLREKVQYPPVSSRYKVYIIDEVHMLTGAAFNALLKTLEEPPKHAVFILATTEVYKIPATILSRCMRFDFRLIPDEKIAALISKIYDEQGKEYDKEAVFAIAKAGEGSIRDALSIADTAISYGTGKLTYNDVMEILGSSNDDLLYEFVNSVLCGKSGEALSVINQLCGLGKSMGVLTKDITAILRDLLVAKTCKNANSILSLPIDKFTILENIAKSVSEQRLLRCLEIFSDAENALKYTNHPRVVFETASVKATRPDADYNIEALLARINDLETKLKNGSFSVQMSDSQKFSCVSSEVRNIKNNFNDNKNVYTDAKSENSENHTNEVEHIGEKNCKNNEDKVSIGSISLEELKGKMLFNLRKNGSEMLWNVIQTINMKVKGNLLMFITDNNGDMELLEKESIKERIKTALSEFAPFEIQVSLSAKEQNMEAIDDATERIKKIFGDDIVIIK